MRRKFYLFGIIFLGLYVIAALFQSIIFFQIDYQLFRLQSFNNWFLVLTSIGLVDTLIILKYYHHKEYKFAFSTGIISLIAALFHTIFFYFFILLLMRELQDYYIFATVFSLSAGLLYAISLVFSKAGKNPWLRTTGIFMLIVGCFSIYTLILSLNTQLGQSNSIIIQLSQWISLANSLIVVPLILLFYVELKSLKTHNEVSSQNKFSKLVYAAGGIAILMILVLGYKIGKQSYWKNHVPDKVKALTKTFEARDYINSEGDTLLYRLLKPKNYRPDQQYPMVVCLHGGGGWGTDNIRNIERSGFARILSKPENREKYESFLFVPQCPPNYSWGGYLNTPTVDSLVFETITALENEFLIDKNRLYVVGYSLGGYGTWHFISTWPNKFAAAIPAGGEGDPNLATNMLDIPIWAFHGAKDKNVPVSGTRRMIDAIRKKGGDPRYTEFPDADHYQSLKLIKDTPEILDWLFAQYRD